MTGHGDGMEPDGDSRARADGATAQPTRVVAQVRGDVQGVGFRWWARSQAAALGVTGGATNLPDGTVELVAEGERPAVEELLARVRGPQAPGRVTAVDERHEPPRGLHGFDLA